MNPSRSAAAWSAASSSQAARVASSMPHASSDQSTPSAERAVRSAASSASGAAPRRRLASANAVSSVRTSGAAATSRSHARRAGTRRATSSSRCAASGDRARVTTERSSTSSRNRSKRNAAESQGQQRAGGGDDRGGVDAVVAIEIGARAGLPEVLDAERLLRNAEGAADESERVRMAVEDGHDGHVLLVGGDERLQPRPRRAQVAIEPVGAGEDRKSTRLNSSHLVISYAVFCLKKKKTGQGYLRTIERD